MRGDSAPLTRYILAMRRRGFLHCITLSTLAAVLPWRDLGGWQVDGEATAPGAILQIDIAKHVPANAALEVDIAHVRPDGVCNTVRAIAQRVTPGQQLRIPTPYPYRDLVAGTYDVTLTLRDEAGREIDRHEAGRYTVRRFRFSA